MDQIEVIDRYNARHGFPADKHHYEWRMIAGTMEEGSEFLDVFRIDDGGMTLIATFPNPARVGVMPDGVGQTIPMRQMPLEQCPRCGLAQVVNSDV